MSRFLHQDIFFFNIYATSVLSEFSLDDCMPQTKNKNIMVARHIIILITYMWRHNFSLQRGFEEPYKNSARNKNGK